MPRWTLIALDERDATSISILLSDYLQALVADRSLGTEHEIYIVLKLIQVLQAGQTDLEILEVVPVALRALERRIPSAVSAQEPLSRKLNWPGDSAWIEAQSSAGKLA